MFLQTILDKAKNIFILCIGDIMLDHYLYGTVDRICPEAPVPVVKIDRETWHPGGAANAARNVLALGATSCLIGYCGERVLLHTNSYPDCNTHKGITIKHRVMAGEQQLIRYDDEKINHISFNDYDHLVKEILPKCSAVIVSDYGKGMVSYDLMAYLVWRSKIVVVDPYIKHYSFYNGVNAITPNEKQYEYFNTFKINSDYYSDAILITKGKEGMELLVHPEMNDNDVTHYKTTKFNSLDVITQSIVGAGDVATAAFTVALATGASFKESAEFANICAGVAVQYEGTCVTRKEEVEKWVKRKI